MILVVENFFLMQGKNRGAKRPKNRGFRGCLGVFSSILADKKKSGGFFKIRVVFGLKKNSGGFWFWWFQNPKSHTATLV